MKRSSSNKQDGNVLLRPSDSETAWVSVFLDSLHVERFTTADVRLYDYNREVDVY